ncbi:MAG: hypothetical protein LBO73_04875 [Holosporaceae bacterium]|jgi:hypothetical protein|nr:hypothetical protein [Holosporaceae bacterium]
MRLIGNIRDLTAGYYRDFEDVPDTEENLATGVVMESGNKECRTIVANRWPDSIQLDASVVPERKFSRVFAERRERSRSVCRISIYDSPATDAGSEVKNIESCCSGVTVEFENTGRYILDGETRTFTGSDPGDCRIVSKMRPLFEKKFPVCTESVTEIEQMSLIAPEPYRFYPYGGLYEYGMHPRQAESCIFRTVRVGDSLSLAISPLSALRAAGIDVFSDRQTGGRRLIGIKNFPAAGKIDLYEELKSGACRLEVLNKNTGEKAIYVGNAVFHTPKTNLIAVNFIKQGETP